MKKVSLKKVTSNLLLLEHIKKIGSGFLKVREFSKKIIESEKKLVTVTKATLPPLSEYNQYLKKIWKSRWLTNNGEFLQSLEHGLKDYLRVKNLVLVSNGTLALQLALRELNLKGDVITTPFTFAATTNAIVWEGLNPVFADIHPETYNIDPVDVERKITNRTSAILAVHVYGNPCDMDALQTIAHKHHLKLIYDAAHAFGVEYNHRSILGYGDISILSFHATKVFNTIEGGALVVKDEEMSARLQLLINHGIMYEEKVVLPGTNAKMNEFQAAMGLCNLKNIEKHITMRNRLYDYYKKKLNCFALRFQKLSASKYNYSYMPVLFESCEKRDEVYLELIKNGIKPRRYFFPLTVDFDYFHKQNLAQIERCNLIHAFDISNRLLCLPIYPDLAVKIVDKIIKIIIERL